jgi:uncharacterized C2H2 Zn-finger protein
MQLKHPQTDAYLYVTCKIEPRLKERIDRMPFIHVKYMKYLQSDGSEDKDEKQAESDDEKTDPEIEQKEINSDEEEKKEETKEELEPDDDVTCPRCKQKFASKRGLGVHFTKICKKETPRSLRCNTCQKTFASKQSLDRHVETFHGTKLTLSVVRQIFREELRRAAHT